METLPQHGVQIVTKIQSTDLCRSGELRIQAAAPFLHYSNISSRPADIDYSDRVQLRNLHKRLVHIAISVISSIKVSGHRLGEHLMALNTDQLDRRISDSLNRTKDRKSTRLNSSH